MDFLIVGNGMFGSAIARYLAPHAAVTVVGPGTVADGARGHGAHYDEGRIIGDASRDVIWSELNRRARHGMTELDPGLITLCGAVTATTRELVYQPTAGHFSPRRYVALATKSAREHGATIVRGVVRALRTSAGGAEAELDDGRQIRAEAAIVASGAFAAGSDLLPVPVALRAKSEVYAMAELDDQQAAALTAMPCVNRTIDHPELADLYVLPPIRYPDGRTYLKLGANTMIDHWLPDPAAVRAWYDHGDEDGPLPAFQQILADLLPEVRVRGWHTRRCSDAYTAHRRPYIDILEPGRLTIALGGNGRGAQAADAVGQVTASLALAGRWESDLPQDAFRHVPAAGPWHGMILLRDQAR